MFVLALLPALVLATSGSSEQATDPAVAEVLQCIRRNVPKQSSASDARFVSTDRAGGTREFEARLLAKRMPDGLRRAKICVTAPPDLRGAQVLAMESEAGLPDSFLYTPELRTPKRITGEGLGHGIFGTDLTFEDFERFMSLNRAETTRRLPDEAIKGRPTFVLESSPVEPGRASYSRAKLWIDHQSCVVLQAEFYQGGDMPRRVLEVDLDRVVTKDGLSYPGSVTMRDLAAGTQTLLEITASVIDGTLVTDRELEVGELGRYCR
jgi:hypothetical protein